MFAAENMATTLTNEKERKTDTESEIAINWSVKPILFACHESLVIKWEPKRFQFPVTDCHTVWYSVAEAPTTYLYVFIYVPKQCKTLAKIQAN